MSVIFDALRIAQEQAAAVEADPTQETGAAHKEWMDARGIDEMEFSSVCALMATGLPVQQGLRVMYEAGFMAALRTPVDKIAPD